LSTNQNHGNGSRIIPSFGAIKKLEQEIKQWKKIGFGGIPNNRNGAATFYFYESF
jgi:hypothetical protein